MKIIRFINATFIGYLITSLFTITISLTLPFYNKAESVLFATMLSFFIWLTIILYSYGSKSAKKSTLLLISICIVLAFINNFVLKIKG
ncbi:hypothetical protein [Arcobacter sp. CECT 8985]|uniref:hypothetical protein n=1 Tax=Arcobacter sp. CECT 8985 TaxID=1935424 RepID=UPI00100B747F|nr:hypothetical protein [Arcobacter sp. CECT 8985]RXJ86771.1 hypothetical protein CRU93_06790 [Arcobacter sp. CECT 8985]